jgi:hypothetical protein
MAAVCVACEVATVAAVAVCEVELSGLVADDVVLPLTCALCCAMTLPA